MHQSVPLESSQWESRKRERKKNWPWSFWETFVPHPDSTMARGQGEGCVREWECEGEGREGMRVERRTERANERKGRGYEGREREGRKGRWNVRDYHKERKWKSKKRKKILGKRRGERMFVYIKKETTGRKKWKPKKENPKEEIERKEKEEIDHNVKIGGKKIGLR